MSYLETIGEVLINILEPKSTPLSKFLGVLIASLFHRTFAALVLFEAPPKIAEHLRKQAIIVVNAVVLTAAYLYSWSFGNPHEAVALENTPAFEVPLMLTAGHYILNLFPYKSLLDLGHHILSIVSIMELLIEGNAANVGVTFAFLVEIASLCYIARNAAIRFQSLLAPFLKVLYPIVFIVVRFIVLLHLAHKIHNNEDLPDTPRAAVGFLFMCTFCYCYRMYCHIIEVEKPRQSRSRSRTSRSRSRSRNRSRRSRTRSRTGSRFRRCDEFSWY